MLATSRYRVYSAFLTGDAEIPKVNTDATGEAQFDSNAQAAALGDSAAASSSGSDISYEVDVQNIEKITAADIQWSSSYFVIQASNTIWENKRRTGERNVKRWHLEGPLLGEQISDLLDLFDNGEAYLNIHAAANPDGEIRGPIQQARVQHIWYLSRSRLEMDNLKSSIVVCCTLEQVRKIILESHSINSSSK